MIWEGQIINRRIASITLFLSILVLGSLGCSLGSLIVGESAPTPTPTKSLVSTFTATATHTATATPTETATPMDTPIPLPTDAPPPSATPTPPYTTYVVQAGDTLSSIAARFDTTAQAIKNLNGLTSDIINIGQELLIPSGENPVSPPPSPTSTSGTAPAATPRPPQPAATSTPRPPTATPEPSHPYHYVEGSRTEEENGCSNMGVQGSVQDASGNPVTGAVTVKWQWEGGTEYWVTGNPVELPGIFKFSIIRGPAYHGSKTFVLTIIESQANPVPLSEPLSFPVQDCADGPELFKNIIFRHR